MACLLFYCRGYKKWQGFKILSPPYFCTFLSLQPLHAQKLTVLLIFVKPVEQIKKGKKGCFARNGEPAPYHLLSNMQRCKTFG